MDHSHFIEIALDQAQQSRRSVGIAVGAVLAKAGEVVAMSHDRSRQLNDPIAVAEMDCIRQAGRRNDQQELTLYTTRYPDMLVAGTLIQFSIGRLVIGPKKSNSPAIELLIDKGVSVDFMGDSRCASEELE